MDMALLVESQGETLQNIEENVSGLRGAYPVLGWGGVDLQEESAATWAG